MNIQFISKTNLFSIQRKLTPYLFLLPALILLSLTVFWPALQAFYLSFTTYQDIGEPPKWIGLANFLKLWKDAVFWKTLENTFLYLVGVVPILVMTPLILAILVNQKLRGMNWFRTAYYTPVVISMVVAGIAWKWLYAENGLLNQIFKTLGIFPEGIPWLTSPDKILGIVPISLASVMAVTIWKGLGYYMVIYLAGLQSIPGDIYEAAAIDGSDNIRKHLDITIPLMQPYLALVAVISAISATKVFEEVYIMTGGGPLNSSKTIVYYLYEQAFINLEFSYACTIGLVLFLIILGLSVLRLLINQQDSNNLGV
ncbi:sugar ABC transporter permease [Sphaerospermopsis aphanizomenoides BCCUSP55]|uniref:carbohydrate ABC transporter permease n=1 Tax=Sphaerospermopsis aphanizomenoides TaxID=459663 RepID=UPI00190353C5|nr:sugar ABC transporter permease [Sphaerospermopsis aphanizomenoides]MBK1990336.1 sugar ABC transporter permease [Sphaerospermopsis aphanizomenoides BCCUSP55]